jgi:hypothetical protein
MRHAARLALRQIALEHHKSGWTRLRSLTDNKPPARYARHERPGGGRTQFSPGYRCNGAEQE